LSERCHLQRPQARKCPLLLRWPCFADRLRHLQNSSLIQRNTRYLCSTSEYLALEIIDQQPYSMTVDWWQLGILMYEMLADVTPFLTITCQRCPKTSKHILQTCAW
jgi:serine/threonine protein kinase